MITIIEISVMMLVLGLFLLYLMIKVPKGYALKYLAVPAFLFLIFFTSTQLPNVLGLAKDAYPTDKFHLYGYRDTWKSNKHVLEIWIIEAKNTSRLFRIPFSQKVEQELQTMMQGNAQGKNPTGRFIHKGLKSKSHEGKRGNGNGKEGNGGQTNGDDGDIDLTTDDLKSTPLPSKPAAADQGSFDDQGNPYQ